MKLPPGLTTDEARRRLAEHGPNTLPAATAEPLWHRLARQFRSPLIYILLFALVVDLAVWALAGTHGWPLESIAIAVILLLNAGLGLWQEHKAESALARLEKLAAPQAWVARDGDLVRLPAAELVCGDVVRLESGDRVPADATAAAAENLQVDESVLTGESLPVDKVAEAPLFAGTLVARGRAYVEITRIGQASAMGRLAEMLGTVEAEASPLERRLQRFGHRVARWVLTLTVAIAAGGIAVQGIERFDEVFLFAVALAVAAVPEGLPAVLTVTLALGVERMAGRAAVVRKLASVEALGSVTVIATDKTGTLTENRMHVRDVDTPDTARALEAMVLANDAESSSGAGDPLEQALLAHAADTDCDVERLRAGFSRSSSRPFDSQWKFMRATGTRHGRPVSYVKGAPEVVLERCTMSDRERAAWGERIDAHAAGGHRLLALASGDGETEAELEWLGVVLLWDPPRAEVPDAVRAARAAGIRIVMITGDHPDTAATVARSVGMEADRVVRGDELASLDPTAFERAVRTADVMARVSPEQKLRIVEAFQSGGEVVAVTGDGVNDAPALKRADVGVAMGERGSDVSREVADLVLLDDNFATIVAAIEEGRGIYENIEKFIRFLFSTNLSEVIVVTGGAMAAIALGMRDAAGSLLLPVTAVQLLWINLVTDGAPALALGVDRNPGVLERAPRDPASPLLDRASLAFVLTTGSLKALIAFAILGLLPAWGDEPVEVTRTATFAFLAAGQLLFAYPARHTDLRPLGNRILDLSIALSLAAQLLVLAVPPIMAAVGTVSLSVQAAVAVVVSMTVSWAMAEAVTRFIWRRA